MPEVVEGLAQNPAVILEQAFREVAETAMHSLPFYRAQIPVRACGFQLFEGQWFGCMLTPWMLSLLVLPGPDQRWERRKVGEKLSLSLPCGSVCFTVGEIDGCGQYLAASLMSPLESHMSADQAVVLSEQTARMALSLPVMDTTLPENPSRRALFSKGSAHA